MRSSLFLAGMAVATTLAGTAAADTITDSIAFTNPADGATSEFGPTFNTAMGTLTNVSFLFSGTYTPNIVGSNITSTQSNLFYTFGPPGTGGGSATPLGSFTLNQNGRFLTGAPEAFTFSVASVPFLAAYLNTPGNSPTAWLGNVDVFSEPGTKYAWGIFDDNSIYSGTLKLTYTYTVAEPASAALLALGLCAALFASRKRAVI